MLEDTYRSHLEAFEANTGEKLTHVMFDGSTASLPHQDRMHQLPEELQHKVLAVDDPRIQDELDRPFLNDNAPVRYQRLRFVAWSDNFVAWWAFDGEAQTLEWFPARPAAPTFKTNTLMLETSAPPAEPLAKDWAPVGEIIAARRAAQQKRDTPPPPRPPATKTPASKKRPEEARGPFARIVAAITRSDR